MGVGALPRTSTSDKMEGLAQPQPRQNVVHAISNSYFPYTSSHHMVYSHHGIAIAVCLVTDGATRIQHQHNANQTALPSPHVSR